MKHPNSRLQLFIASLTATALATSFAPISVAADLYLPVYSQVCGQIGLPLHIMALDPQTLVPQGQWDFSAAYAGHRAVCRLPGANTNSAFVGWTGTTPYDPSDGGQYGFAAASDAPVLGLDFGSAATQMYGDYSPFFSTRLNLWSAGTMEINARDDLREPASQLDSTSPLRVRVVRWKLDDAHLFAYSLDVYRVESCIILDKVINPLQRQTLTEADFLNADTLDIDWNNFYDEVVTNKLVEMFRLPIVKAEYLVLLGYNPYTSWDNSTQTNRWLWASKKTITRFYGLDRVAPTPLPLTFSAGQFPKFEWTLDCPEREGYTAFRLRLLNSSGSTLRATNVVRMPPNANFADPRHGCYSWTPPVSWMNYITNAASWSVEVYNAKYRHDSAITNTAAIIYSP